MKLTMFALVPAVVLAAPALAQLSSVAPPSGPAPCPIAMEIKCDTPMAGTGEGSPPSPSPACACGTGSWVRMLPVTQITPATPVTEINTSVNINSTTWLTTREAYATACHAEVHVAGQGASHFWGAGSIARSAGARYSAFSREEWVGTGIPCPRMVTLAAAGGAGLTLTLTCAAEPGCGASGSASVSGSCSSLGNACATIENKQLNGTVAYNASTESTEIAGHFGAEIDDSSATVEGSISRVEEWSVRGAGNVSGSATYTVREDRTYCAFTNRPIARLATGVAICAAGATVDENGSAAFDARAFISICVN